MKPIFSTLYKLRMKLERKDFAINKRNFTDKVKTYLGLLRGYLCYAKGHVMHKGDYRPFILGVRVDFDIWPGAIITLIGKNDSKKVINPANRYFPTASSIGVSPPYDHMNPPTVNSTRVRLREGAKLILDQNTSILIGSYIAVGPNKTLSIGSETEINHGVMINTICGLEIGKNVMIANGAVIMDYDGHPVFSFGQDKQKDTYAGNAKPIKIEDNVWIGTRATILKGVTLGSGSIVAANSCVSFDVPSNSIVGGNPARVIKENHSWRKY